jgi:hypothetical protein
MMSIQRRVLLGFIASACVPAALWATDAQAAPPSLSAQQIVEKHVAARGGLSAWRAVQTMSWSGSMEAGAGDSVTRSKLWVAQTWGRKGGKGPKPAAADTAKDAAAPKPDAKQVLLPFVMDVKRPGMSRVELEFEGKKAVQVFDGKNGWMTRPYLNRDDWEPFSKEQTESQLGKWDVDGPLFDYAAKGTKVALEGVDKVDGQDSYRLKLTLKGGKVQHIWIDAHSFLDVKVEAVPRRMDGRMHPVYVYQRDFRTVQGGVLVPFVLETVVDGYPDTHKMLIEKVALNPKLDDALFTKPTA